MSPEARPSSILIVEDDSNDVFFLRKALEKVQVRHPLRIVNDGQEAIDYLSGTGPYADRERYPLPCLAILDVKLPRRSGFEVLGWMRQHPELRDLPVFLLTSSAEPRDVALAGQYGIEAYRVKPVSFEGLVDIASEIRDRIERRCGSRSDELQQLEDDSRC